MTVFSISFGTVRLTRHALLRSILAKRHTLRRPRLGLFSAPFRSRAPDQLDLRYVSDHLKRDLGLLNGHRTDGAGQLS